MVIGLLKEIKKDEYRVGLTPQSAQEYINHGHSVWIEKSAGEGSGFTDEIYTKVGCRIEKNKVKILSQANMIIKVKEPLPEEYPHFRESQILFTYLHLAADKRLAKFLLQKKITGIAYETVMEEDASLPLLKPMSEIAGRLAIQEGAKYLEKTFGGRGILLGGVPGIPRGKIFILGGGVVGINACKIAVGIGAEVTILDISYKRLTYLDDIFGTSITTLLSNKYNIEKCLREADLIIGGILIPGGAAPKLIKNEHLKIMKKGAVIVDIAIDQGGCCESSKATTHSSPTFIKEGIVHYCVTNMPSVVALSSTIALTSATTRYGLQVADQGIEDAILGSRAIRSGINTYQGKLKNSAVAEALTLEFTPWQENNH